MKVINLFGGPGTGKSTTATGLFSLLKQKGYRCEYIHEFAKDLTYYESWKQLTDQGFVFANQHHKQFILKDTVDYLITDSPIIMGLCYLSKTDPIYDYNITKDYITSIFNKYDNINILLQRDTDVHPYQEYGRTQSLSEAIEKDTQILELLQEVSYVQIPIDNAVETIYTLLTK